MQSAAWCEGLLREFERRIEACLPRMSNARDRLTTEECTSLVEFAAGMADPLGGVSLCPILPGETGFFDICKNRDTIAATLLEKADPRDGGGRGIPVETPGPGSGLMNAAAAGAFGGNCASLEQALTYSLPLRAAVARTALSRMPDFLDDDSHGEYFRAKFDMYGHEIVDEAKGRGACMGGYPDEFPLPVGSARVLYLLAVQRVTRELGGCQQACLPWLAETLGSKIRCFYPGAGRSVDESVSKKWSRKTFLPLGRSGRSSRRKVRGIPTVHMSLSLVRSSGDPGSPEIIAEERVDPRSPSTRRPGPRHGARTYGRFGLVLLLAKGTSIEVRSQSSSASEGSEGQESSEDETGSEKEARERSRKKAKRKAKAHREERRSRSKRRRSRDRKKASKRSSRSERREIAEEEEELRKKATARDEELDRALDEERKEMRAQARADARAQAGGSAASRREPGLINAGGGSAHDGPSQPSSPGASTSGLIPSQTSSTEADQGSSALAGDNPDPCTSRSTSANNRSRSSNNHSNRSSTSCHGETSDIHENGDRSGMNTSGGAGGGVVEASAAITTQVYVGRTFEKLGSADETWDSIVASLLAAFRVEGHNCLMRRNKKKLYYEEYAQLKRLENRHWVVWVICTHGGAPVARTPLSREVIRRRVSRKVMCPFKVAICWPQREPTPRITQVNVTHNHGLADAHGTKPGGNSVQVSLDALMGDGCDEVADRTPNSTERARKKAYAAMMTTARAMAAKLADSVSPAAATTIFAEVMAVANTRLLAAGVEGPLPPTSESGVDVGLPLGNPAVALAEQQNEMVGEGGPTSA